jgi:hypothetical protein
MNGICRLFGKETILCESHLIPSFAIQYMKATGSRHLRKASNPNLRLQDGIKIPLLGSAAEQLFSRREKWFAENVFYPYMNRSQTAIAYDENLYFFTISFLWRVLVFHLDFIPSFKQFDGIKKLLEVEVEWRRFLTEMKYPSNFPDVQLFLTDRVAYSTEDLPGLDYYTSRACDVAIVFTPEMDYLAIYGKFLRFVFWSVVANDLPAYHGETRVNPIGGSLMVPQNLKDDHFFDFLINRTRQFEELPGPSQTQQEIILKEILANKEKFFNSDAGQSILNDFFKLYH